RIIFARAGGIAARVPENVVSENAGARHAAVKSEGVGNRRDHAGAADIDAVEVVIHGRGAGALDIPDTDDRETTGDGIACRRNTAAHYYRRAISVTNEVLNGVAVN